MVAAAMVAKAEAPESGYASRSSSAEDSLQSQVQFTDSHLHFINQQLALLEPEEILKWSITTFPNLFQTTAFGLTGLVTIDMLAKLSAKKHAVPDAIFIDTLHHFTETLDLVDRVRLRYPSVNLHVFKPASVSTAVEFGERYGDKLWESDDERYDYLAKVEPAQRAYRELGATAVLTGRRRSQGGARGSLPIVEVTNDGLIKINPLANWSFDQVKGYIDSHEVPYNALLDRGYKSVGDWHSTVPVAEGEDERAGRWKGQEKTECGIHNSQSRYARYLREQEEQRSRKQLEEVLQKTATRVAC